MKKKFKLAVVIIALIVTFILLYRNTIAKDVLGVIMLSAIIAYCLMPIQLMLMDRGVSRKIACILILLIMVAFIGLMMFYLIPKVLKDIVNISNNLYQLNSYIEKINLFIDKYFKNKYTAQLFNSAGIKIQGRIKIMTAGLMENLMKNGDKVLSLSVIPIIVYYFLTDGKNLSKFMIQLIPVKKRRILRNFMYDINLILSRYILTQFALCFLIVIMTFVILIIFRMKFPLMLSILNGIFNIIPYFGPLFGAIPILIIAALNSPQKLIWLLLCLNLIQQIEGDIIAPKLTGDTVNIHPLAIIILLIAGGKLGGFFGMVMAVPVAVVIKVIAEDIDYYMY